MFRNASEVYCSAGLLLCAFCAIGPILDAQEAAVMNGAQAVRFEQSPGFFHYVVFCRTPKQFMAQMPPAKLPPDSLEYGLCWYADVSRMVGGSGSQQKADGRIVVSEHHVRFIPRDPQSADLYVDLPREQVELKHEPGQADASLEGKGQALSFRFSKLCPTCAPGTPTPAGLASAALLDQEFALLDETIRQFSSGWRQIYRISSGAAPVDPASQIRRRVPLRPPRRATARPVKPRPSPPLPLSRTQPQPPAVHPPTVHGDPASEAGQDCVGSRRWAAAEKGFARLSD